MAYLREPDPWLYQYARPILAGLSGLGGLLTAYLTLSKLTQQSALGCGLDGGCDLVLASRWAVFLGIPTAAWGFLGFLIVFLLAILPDSIKIVKQWRWPALFVSASGMLAFEMYMLYLMVAVLQQFCFYCLTAIGLVTGIFLVTLLGHRWIDWGRLGFSYVLISLFTLVFTIGVYANQAPPASPLAQGLASHLQVIDGTMYGAYWCPHCVEQKELFGSAFDQVPYVECSPNGQGTPQAEACNEAGIQSYPTWLINGTLYRGRRSLEDLAEISNYEESVAF